MYIYVLLSIFALLLAVECRSWWNMFTDMLNGTIKSEDAHLNIIQLAFKYGHDLEEHQVVTEDSYVIKFHRIPNETGRAVFLMHGITESADCWLLQGPYISLGYALADEGFDVWMGNARGNKYCTEHAVYNSTSSEFWRFTWEEIGLYDLPAMIDYILSVTGRESLYYIGHSQGTTVGYVLLSMKPKYNQKIKLMFSLAPIAWMGNVKSPMITMFSPTANVLSLLDYSILSSGTDLLNKVSPFVCSWLPVKCQNLVYSLMGFDHRINETLWPVILGHMPTGSSTLQFLHYGQLINSKRFCRFDYGKKENMQIYGQATPPDYDTNMIQAPVALYYSDKDWLSDIQDVMKLKSKLPNVFDLIFLRDFGHMDYLYAADARNVVYNRIIAQIKKFEKDGNINNIYFKSLNA